MEIAFYRRALSRHWLLVLVFVVVGLVASAAFGLTNKPSYSATAEAYVSTSTAADPNELGQGTVFAQQAVIGYAQIAVSDLVLRDVIGALKLDETPTELKKMLTVETPVDTSTISITAEDPDATRAAQIANATLTSLDGVIQAVSPASDGTGATVRVTTIQTAHAADEPSSMGAAKLIVIGVFAGLIVGLVAALVRAGTDRRLRTDDDFDAEGVEVVGSLPDSRGAVSPEAIRLLAARLRSVSGAAGAQSVALTGLNADAEVAELAGQVAGVLTRDGASVLLVEWSRTGEIGTNAAAGSTSGSGTAASGIDDEHRLRSSGIKGLLAAIESGAPGTPSRLDLSTLPPQRSGLAASSWFPAAVHDLREHFDLVLLVAPSAASAEAVALSSASDATVLVARRTRTDRGAFRTAVTGVEGIGAGLLGVITLPARTGLRYPAAPANETAHSDAAQSTADDAVPIESAEAPGRTS